MKEFKQFFMSCSYCAIILDKENLCSKFFLYVTAFSSPYFSLRRVRNTSRDKIITFRKVKKKMFPYKVSMKIGEVSLLTNDVPRLAAFYKQLLEIENNSNDETHQFIITEETMLTIYNDGTIKNNQNQNICLAFTVDDIEKEYEKLLSMNTRIIEGPTKRPWGATNMSFYDPDNNMIFFRSFPKNS